jgi:hypothetical protein
MSELNITVRHDTSNGYDEWEARAWSSDGIMLLAIGTGGSRWEAVWRVMYLLDEDGK